MSSAVAELGFAAVEDLIVDVSLDATADAELDALLLLLLPEDAGCASASHRIGGLVNAVWWMCAGWQT